MKRSVTIKENYEFRRLYAKGASAVLPSVVVYCRKNGRAHNRLGVTVSTKLGLSLIHISSAVISLGGRSEVSTICRRAS